MIAHPIVLGILATDAVAAGLAAVAGAFAVRILLGWDPGTASEAQLEREAAAESAEIAAGWSFRLSCASGLLLVAALTNVLPGIVPGAMCGTGVLQSMDGAGGKAIGLRFAALFLLHAQMAVVGVNRASPRSPLTPWIARVQLVALPVLLLAAAATAQALLGVSVERPVDCCAVVYGSVRPSGGPGLLSGIPDAAWLGLFGAAGLAVAAASLGLSRSRETRPGRAAVLLALTAVWMPAAATALAKVLSAYIYEVRHHHCPWCLFLPEHGMAGIPLFGVWLWTGLEAAAAWAASRCGAPEDTAGAAARRMARGARRTAAGVTLFSLLAAAPALIWRVRFGVWF
jgi:hypothetical protein